MAPPGLGTPVAPVLPTPSEKTLANGLRTVYLPVTKRGDASTLEVVELVKKNIPEFQKILPDDIKVTYVFDQSPVVNRSIKDVLKEGGLGAILTGLMVLLFLRDWRSAFIVVINIPIALLAGTFALWMSGQNINLMTLGGLAYQGFTIVGVGNDGRRGTTAFGVFNDFSAVTIEHGYTRVSGAQVDTNNASHSKNLEFG